MGYMTDERRLIQETARAFAMKEVLPVANRLDPEKGDIPPELIQKLADMNIKYIVEQNQKDNLIKELVKENANIIGMEMIKPSLEEIFYLTRGNR